MVLRHPDTGAVPVLTWWLISFCVRPVSVEARVWVIFIFFTNLVPYPLLVLRSSIMGSGAAALVCLRKDCSEVPEDCCSLFLLIKLSVLKRGME